MKYILTIFLKPKSESKDFIYIFFNHQKAHIFFLYRKKWILNIYEKSDKRKIQFSIRLEGSMWKMRKERQPNGWAVNKFLTVIF